MRLASAQVFFPQRVITLGRASGVKRGIVISRMRRVSSILAQEYSNAGCLEK